MLADVIEALRGVLDARSCPVPVYLGEQFLRDNAGCSRIVIVPMSDTYGPKSPSVRPGTFGPTNPRAIATRITGATAHIWTFADLNSTDASKIWTQNHRMMDALIQAFLASMDGVTFGTMKVSGGTYVTDQAIHDALGIAYQLPFTVEIPVLDVAYPFGLTTFTPAEATANVQIQEKLGPDQTYQTGAAFEAPDETDAP